MFSPETLQFLTRYSEGMKTKPVYMYLQKKKKLLVQSGVRLFKETGNAHEKD